MGIHIWQLLVHCFYLVMHSKHNLACLSHNSNIQYTRLISIAIKEHSMLKRLFVTEKCSTRPNPQFLHSSRLNGDIVEPCWSVFPSRGQRMISTPWQMTSRGWLSLKLDWNRLKSSNSNIILLFNPISKPSKRKRACRFNIHTSEFMQNHIKMFGTFKIHSFCEVRVNVHKTFYVCVMGFVLPL